MNNEAIINSVLHKKLNQPVFYKSKLDSRLVKKCLRFNIILKLITCCKINQVTSKCQMDFLDNTCKKGLKRKKEHQNQILHNHTCLGSKSQLQQTF